MLIDFIIGGSAAVISRTATAPLELYRIQRQNYFIPNATIKDVLKKEGFVFYGKETMPIAFEHFLNLPLIMKYTCLQVITIKCAKQ